MFEVRLELLQAHIGPGQRKVVLANNLAQSAVTLPTTHLMIPHDPLPLTVIPFQLTSFLAQLRRHFLFPTQSSPAPP